MYTLLSTQHIPLTADNPSASPSFLQGSVQREDKEEHEDSRDAGLETHLRERTVREGEATSVLCCH